MNRSSNSIYPLLMILLGVLLIAGAGAWYLTGGGLLAGRTPSETVIVTEDTDASIPRIEVGDARAALETSSAVFVDVRDARSYAQGHIRGALSIPLEELPDRMRELDPNNWIITYCT